MHERADRAGPAPAPEGPVAAAPAVALGAVLTPEAVLSLQRTAGNVAVQRAILARDLASDYEDADIITTVLKSKYNTGVDAGKTAEQYDMEQYAKMAPNKDAGVK